VYHSSAQTVGRGQTVPLIIRPTGTGPNVVTMIQIQHAQHRARMPFARFDENLRRGQSLFTLRQSAWHAEGFVWGGTSLPASRSASRRAGIYPTGFLFVRMKEVRGVAGGACSRVRDALSRSIGEKENSKYLEL
jgi:hypothetical protein